MLGSAGAHHDRRRQRPLRDPERFAGAVAHAGPVGVTLPVGFQPLRPGAAGWALRNGGRRCCRVRLPVAEAVAPGRRRCVAIGPRCFLCQPHACRMLGNVR